MSFLNPIFYLFIPIFLILYYLIPQRYRYIVIFVGSYFFYGYANIQMLAVLAAITLLTYIGGFIIEKKKNKIVLVTFFVLNIAVLFVFKYTNFIIKNINVLRGLIENTSTQISPVNLILPVGLSFIIFQSCTYLTDVYRDNVHAEYNIIKYASFVAFFPTVLSGPIQKARDLLPQIARPAEFNAEQAKKGTIVFVWGLFEKIIVANKLQVIVNRVFSDYSNYNSAYYIIAAIAFSLYIYADFSSYSDMARGISMLMGIDVGKNFKNPYLSRSTSEFWTRWHASLNSWFVENVYIPLGGNRHGKIRKYINVFIVFLLSGFWHGADYHFIAWGVVNGLFVIIGQILKPVKLMMYHKLRINENSSSIVFLKRVVVFVLITISWIFFNNGVRASFHIIKSMIFFQPIRFFDSNLLTIAGTLNTTFVTIMSAIIFGVVQVKRQNETLQYKKYSAQPMVLQVIVLSLLICACMFGACATDTIANTQFLYFQF